MSYMNGEWNDEALHAKFCKQIKSNHDLTFRFQLKNKNENQSQTQF